MDNFADAITYEIKREVANRYFGFRKEIESQICIYQDKLEKYNHGLRQKISRDLHRLSHLLPDDAHFHSACSLTGLPEDFIEELMPVAARDTTADLFAGMQGTGFTRKGRYRNLAHNVYQLLAEHLDNYVESFADLDQQHAAICSHIKDFYRNNDLSGILGFFREIDSAGNWKAGTLQGDIPVDANRSLDRDLCISPPPPVHLTMSPLQKVPPLKSIKQKFNRILNDSFAQHGFRLPGGPLL